MDVMSSVFALGSKLIGLVKGFAETAKQMRKTEMLSSVIEIQSTLLELQQAQQQLIEDNHGLRDELRALKNAQLLTQSVEAHHNAYWVRKNADELDGPFSMEKWDIGKQLLRLPVYSKNSDGNGMMFVTEQQMDSLRGVEQWIVVPLAFLEENHVRHVLENVHVKK